MNIGRLGTGVTDFMNGGPKGFSPSRQSASTGPSFLGIALASPDVHNPMEEKGQGEASSSSSSLLAGNFFDTRYTRSRYAQASLERFGVEQTMGSRVNALVNEFSSAMNAEVAGRSARSPGMDYSYVTAYKYGIQAKKRLQMISDDEYMRLAREKLEKDREELERKAEEALARSGKNGGQTDSTAQDGAVAAEELSENGTRTDALQSAPQGTQPATQQAAQQGGLAAGVSTQSRDPSEHISGLASVRISVREGGSSAGDPSSATSASTAPNVQTVGEGAAAQEGVDRYV